jgi:hypothetical protein
MKMKCKKPKVYAEFTDIAGHIVSVRKSDVVAYGQSSDEKYSTWILLQTLPAGDCKVFVKDSYETVTLALA